MISAFLLFKLSLKRARLLLGVMGFLLAFFQVLRVRIACTLHDAVGFEQIAGILPPSVRAVLGSSLASVISFRGIVCGGYYDLGVVLALIALVIALATLPASEIETGFADLILARPMPRHWLITRTIALVLFSIVLMLFMTMAGTWIGLWLFTPSSATPPPTYQTNALALNLGLLLLCWSGIALAFGAACRRSAAATTTSLIAFASLIIDYAARLWPAFERVAWLSPFKYFAPFDLIVGDPLPVENLLILWAIAMSGFVLAYYFISERDIHR